MTEKQRFVEVSLESITVDEVGQVIVSDPQVAERLRSQVAVTEMREVTNNGCNTVRGCGDGQHLNPQCTIKK